MEYFLNIISLHLKKNFKLAQLLIEKQVNREI